MLKDITLGQYFPGDSFVHTLDPRTKLLLVVAYIVALFCAGGWGGYALVATFLAVSIVISSIPLKSITRGLKPVMVIVVFTGVLNLFFTPGTTEIFTIFGFTLTWEESIDFLLGAVCIVATDVLTDDPADYADHLADFGVEQWFTHTAEENFFHAIHMGQLRRDPIKMIRCHMSCLFVDPSVTKTDRTV